MSKYYVDSFSTNWADEFEVYFFDIYTEQERNNINWLGKTFPGLKIGYAFGSNENFDSDEGFEFNIDGIEASEQEIKILKKFSVQAESLKNAYSDWVWDHLNQDTRNQWWKQYNSYLDVPEEVFQNYCFELNKHDYVLENDE